MSTDGNGASGVSGTGPARGYKLKTFLVYFFLCAMNMLIDVSVSLFVSEYEYIVDRSLMHVYVMFYILNFWIKIYRKLTRFPTQGAGLTRQSHRLPYLLTWSQHGVPNRRA